MSYTIQILSSQEYDTLPYNKTKESLGLALPDKGLAFVRQTGNKAEDIDSILHELEELKMSESWHEQIEDGERVRYKSFLKKISNSFVTPALRVASVVPSPFQPLAQMASAASQVNDVVNAPTGMRGSTVGRTATGILGAFPIPVVQPLANIANFGMTAYDMTKGRATPWDLGASAIAGAPSVIKAASSMMNPATTALPKTGTDAIMGMPAAIGKNASQIAQNNTNLSSSLPAFTSQIPSVLGNMPSGNTPSNPTINNNPVVRAPFVGLNAPSSPIQTPTTQEVTPAPSFFKNAEKTLSSSPNLLGGTSLLGAAAIKQPQFEMPSGVEDIRQKLLSGNQLTEQGRLAQGELSNILKSTPQELYPTANDEYYNAALRRTRESYAEAEKQLDAAYNNAGMLGSGEHMAEKAKLKEQLARTESGLAAETEQRRFELARTAKYQAIQDSLNVDRATMDDLIGLTGLDVQTAAIAYGAQVKDVEEIRKALGTIGSELLVRGRPGQVQVQTSSNILGS